MSQTPTEILQRLYDSEINCQLSSFWDGGWQWKLGDDMNGFRAEGSCQKLDRAVLELAEAAAVTYPGSVFTNWWLTTFSGGD